jgi:protein-disulfide isomerase
MSKSKKNKPGKTKPGKSVGPKNAAKPVGDSAKSAASTSNKDSKTRKSTAVAAEKIAALRAKENRRRWINRSLIGLAVLLAAALIGYVVYNIQQVADLPNPQGKPPKNYSVPQGATKTGLAIGNSQAPVTVELYLDYNCPHCKDFEDDARKYFQEKVNDKQIKLIYHPIARISPYSVLASSASGCAQDAGKFEQFSTELFKRQGDHNFDDKTLKKIGDRIGLDSKKFTQCVEDRHYLNWALGLNQEANKRKIQGTPTAYVDDERLVPTSESFFPVVKSVIEDRLKKANQQ